MLMMLNLWEAVFGLHHVNQICSHVEVASIQCTAIRTSSYELEARNYQIWKEGLDFQLNSGPSIGLPTGATGKSELMRFRVLLPSGTVNFVSTEPDTTVSGFKRRASKVQFFSKTPVPIPASS